jgi:hypothetical protein
MNWPSDRHNSICFVGSVLGLTPELTHELDLEVNHGYKILLSM